MMRMSVAFGAALVLSAGQVADAQAATGDFSYVNVNGDDFTLHDPPNGECFLLVGGAQSAANHTDSRAVLYSEHGCEGGARLVMERGTSARFGASVPHSVMFG